MVFKDAEDEREFDALLRWVVEQLTFPVRYVFINHNSGTLIYQRMTYDGKDVSSSSLTSYEASTPFSLTPGTMLFISEQDGSTILADFRVKNKKPELRLIQGGLDADS